MDILKMNIDAIGINGAMEFVSNALKDKVNDSDKIKTLDGIINKIQLLKDIELVCQAKKEAIVRGIMNPVKPEKESKGKYGTVKWLADLLDKKVQTIYGYVRRNEVPYLKQGKSVLFDKEEIYQFIEKGKIHASSQVKADALKYLMTIRKN